VGRVESIDLTKSPAPEAVIEFSAPISVLEWVIITPNPKADLEGAEEGMNPSGSEGSTP
jgi:rod shape-determining protein MreC